MVSNGVNSGHSNMTIVGGETLQTFPGLGMHSSGTKSRKMRNQYGEDHKFASFLIIAYIYEAIITLFSEMNSI